MEPEWLTCEWVYRYNERLGIFCGSNPPTDEQKYIARSEADAAIKLLEKCVDNDG